MKYSHHMTGSLKIVAAARDREKNTVHGHQQFIRIVNIIRTYVNVPQIFRRFWSGKLFGFLMPSYFRTENSKRSLSLSVICTYRNFVSCKRKVSRDVRFGRLVWLATRLWSVNFEIYFWNYLKKCIALRLKRNQISYYLCKTSF